MSESFSLFAGWLIDGTGGPAKTNVLIRIEDGLFASIELLEQRCLRPQGCLDLSGCTVVPGLVDCHVHLFMSGTSDEGLREQQLTFSFEQARAVISRHLDRQVSHGVVAVRDGGDYASHNLRYKNECLPDERFPVYVRAAGRAWRASGRYGRLIGRPPLPGCTLAQSIASMEEKADHLKIVNSGINSLKRFGAETPPQFTFEELKAAIDIGKTLGLKTMVHANGRVPVGMAARAGCHSVEHGFFMGRENLKDLADHQIFWVPTAYTMKAYAEHLGSGNLESEIARKNLDHQLEQLRYAKEAGVAVAVGTDCGSLGVHHGESFCEEVMLLAEAGFPVETALQCATLNGALLLGLADEVGEVRAGMPATFLIVRGSPSSLPDALRSPERLYVRGRLVRSSGSPG